ncbi:MAG: hypothetical protein EA382_01165 [Spirochaetaceae bacterium]|nr:MAG: hypothetical protein EA382_01165 [Spirochaetaceae bacterium]
MAGSALIRRIWLTIALLFCAQIAITVLVVAVYRIDLRNHRWFVITLPIAHVVVGGVLSLLKRLFRTEDGRQLDRVNLPNVFSITRLSSAPTLLWLVLNARTYDVAPVLIPLTALVFLTDLLDGQISRRTGQVTHIGKYLDSSSDYTLVFIVSIALVSYSLLAPWLFALILARLALQWVGQAILMVAQGWKLPFRTSFLGKASIFAIMTFSAVSLLRLLPDRPDWFAPVYAGLEIATAALTAVSLVEKFAIFAKDAVGVARGGTSSTSPARGATKRSPA